MSKDARKFDSVSDILREAPSARAGRWNPTLSERRSDNEGTDTKFNSQAGNKRLRPRFEDDEEYKGHNSRSDAKGPRRHMNKKRAYQEEESEHESRKEEGENERETKSRVITRVTTNPVMEEGL